MFDDYDDWEKLKQQERRFGTEQLAPPRKMTITGIEHFPLSVIAQINHILEDFNTMQKAQNERIKAIKELLNEYRGY